VETSSKPKAPAAFAGFAPVPELDPVAYDRLTRDVLSLLGVDLSQYRPAQVWRRITCFARARSLADADALVARAREDPVLRQSFLDMLTINVSEFFRNPESWDFLVERYLEPMLGGRLPVRMWSAGCSLGFEPYSLAMLVRELAPGKIAHLLATDIDETALSRAQAGLFNGGQMGGVSEDRKARFFQRAGDTWEVCPEIRAMIEFRRHDLLKDPFERPFDIIVCRNVVIYFTEAAKKELYRRFFESLPPGGVLFLGATESIPNIRDVGLVAVGPNFYERPEPRPPAPPDRHGAGGVRRQES
jgi:chemotaxis protein methyltransferase CheR